MRHNGRIADQVVVAKQNHSKNIFYTYGYKRNWLNAMFLNNVAWAAFEGIDNKEGLEGALMMSEKVITQLQPGVGGNMDTYANILYKLGRKDEALKWQQKAVAAAPDNKDLQAAYEKMQKGEVTWPVKQ